jgi:hypothetical protein
MALQLFLHAPEDYPLKEDSIVQLDITDEEDHAYTIFICGGDWTRLIACDGPVPARMTREERK